MAKIRRFAGYYPRSGGSVAGGRSAGRSITSPKALPSTSQTAGNAAVLEDSPRVHLRCL